MQLLVTLSEQGPKDDIVRTALNLMIGVSPNSRPHGEERARSQKGVFATEPVLVAVSNELAGGNFAQTVEDCLDR
jgi:hypothetical protein